MTHYHKTNIHMCAFCIYLNMMRICNIMWHTHKRTYHYYYYACFIAREKYVLDFIHCPVMSCGRTRVNIAAHFSYENFQAVSSKRHFAYRSSSKCLNRRRWHSWGSFSNQDGRSNGLTAPNPMSQAALLTSAWMDAGSSAFFGFLMATKLSRTRILWIYAGASCVPCRLLESDQCMSSWAHRTRTQFRTSGFWCWNLDRP